jgi:hypothetical protein
MNLVTGVYDSVPQPQKYPYITIGEDLHSEWSTSTNLGSDVSVVINTWDRSNKSSDTKARGKKKTKQIQGEIFDALNRANLTYPGYDIISIEQQNSESFIDADGITVHGVQTFRVLIDRI